MRIAHVDGEEPAVAEALGILDAMGTASEAWATAMSRGAAMSGRALGSPDARRRWCAAIGQRRKDTHR